MALNEQHAPNGIEWTRVALPDGTRTRGFTWNPISGCQHACRWQMPDGKIAECYAETNAENGVAKSQYPQGFAHHYWKPHLLDEPRKLKQSAGIFVGSMADVFGAWVPDEQINAVLDSCANAPQHTFFILTKNAPRLLKFKFPSNVWVGSSSPPDFMFGKPLSVEQRERMIRRTLEVLTEVKASVRWMSIEPLSHDYSAIFREFPTALTWAVIGAASDGKRKFPPSETDLRNTLEVLDAHNVSIFYKGNMRSLPYAAANWRESFPVVSAESPAPVQMLQNLQPVESSDADPLLTTALDLGATVTPAADPDPIPPVPLAKIEPDYADPFGLQETAKVISIRPVYAALLMTGEKHIEWRNWQPSNFRAGTLVIHASQVKPEDLDLAASEPFASALRAHGYDPAKLPSGVALGTVILDRIVPGADILGVLSDKEKAFGYATEENKAWCVSRPRFFREPIPLIGALGLRAWHDVIGAKRDDPAPPASGKTTVVHFQQVYQHWNKATQTWDDPRIVYIGRYMPSFNLPGSLFANPFKIASDTPANRATAIEQYRTWITSKLNDPEEGAKYRAELEALRGRTLACWCKSPDGDPAKSKACHGDVLVGLLGEADDPPTAAQPEPERVKTASVQMSLFDLAEVRRKDYA